MRLRSQPETVKGLRKDLTWQTKFLEKSDAKRNEN
jgi:hypothetical protein